MVNAFKYSFIKGNQYGLRIAVAASSATLDVFGLGWNAPSWRKVSILVKELVLTISAKRIPHLTFPLSIFRKPRSYLGVVSNKLETLSNYKAALIIENDPAFLTEKIFDSFFAGCIPIYVGKEAAKFEIPAHLFVEADVTIQSVQDAMVIALNMDYLKWRSSLDTWLNDERTKEKWSSERVLPRIAQMALEFNTK
jgi:hypothetical protein